MDAETAARWSAWPALICYVLAWALFLWRQDHSTRFWTRFVWTTGCVALVLHVILALLLVHNGSWSAAYEHTAARTASLIGWNWGGGVWFNLITAFVWGGDVLRMWLTNPVEKPRITWSKMATECYLAFMMFNATVVFGSSFAQYAGCAACAGLAGIAYGMRHSD